MLERPLSLAVVVEAEFVDGCVADRPRVGEVPLLISVVGNGSETGNICARSLEHREWRDQVVIVEVVINAEVLLAIEAMVKPQCELVGTLGLHRRSHQFVAVIGWDGDKLKEVNCCGIETGKRNDVFLAGCQISKDAGTSAARTIGVSI